MNSGQYRLISFQEDMDSTFVATIMIKISLESCNTCRISPSDLEDEIWRRRAISKRVLISLTIICDKPSNPEGPISSPPKGLAILNSRFVKSDQGLRAGGHPALERDPLKMTTGLRRILFSF
ncbi:hypothetical protein CEXT_311581 [Caerostris extrusa]|uniref:Uncharacterized protein n=1 Tax=Caerostris extrusa TaxID=172846 RepID=A0AAV4NK01_CAEEX|nr:hypothetical protein CEXT_311581 [Caerostris extrusa]